METNDIVSPQPAVTSDRVPAGMKSKKTPRPKTYTPQEQRGQPSKISSDGDGVENGTDQGEETSSNGKTSSSGTTAQTPGDLQEVTSTVTEQEYNDTNLQASNPANPPSDAAEFRFFIVTNSEELGLDGNAGVDSEELLPRIRKLGWSNISTARLKAHLKSDTELLM